MKFNSFRVKLKCIIAPLFAPTQQLATRYSLEITISTNYTPDSASVLGSSSYFRILLVLWKIQFVDLIKFTYYCQEIPSFRSQLWFVCRNHIKRKTIRALVLIQISVISTHVRHSSFLQSSNCLKRCNEYVQDKFLKLYTFMTNFYHFFPKFHKILIFYNF